MLRQRLSAPLSAGNSEQTRQRGREVRVSSEVRTGVIETRIPGRLDRLPWARWHWLVVIGLGTEWFIGVEAAGRSLETWPGP